VVSEDQLVPGRPVGAPAAAVGRTYRILITDEVDPYDTPVPRTSIAPSAAAVAHLNESFAGTARKAAKLSIATVAAQAFNDVQALIATLPSKDTMLKLKPPLKEAATSGRVAQENRNIQLMGFLYAASREADNDYHLIVGRDPGKNPPIYMTAEVSGLPPKKSASFGKLNSVRSAYNTFFQGKLPHANNYHFYDPPIPMQIEGSLFFDVTHAHGQGPGPKSLHANIPTIWEIHPVTKIIFEP
jgi:hypothetical protein